MNGFAANSEVANSSLTDAMLRALTAAGTLFATMDVTPADPVTDVVVVDTGQRLVYAIEIGVHNLAN